MLRPLSLCCWCFIVICAVLLLIAFVAGTIVLVLSCLGRDLMHLKEEAGREKYTAGDSALFSLALPPIPLLCSYEVVDLIHNSLDSTLYLLKEAPLLSEELNIELKNKTLTVPPKDDGFLLWSFYLHNGSDLNFWMCMPSFTSQRVLSFNAIKGVENFTAWKQPRLAYIIVRQLITVKEQYH